MEVVCFGLIYVVQNPFFALGNKFFRRRWRSILNILFNVGVPKDKEFVKVIALTKNYNHCTWPMKLLRRACFLGTLRVKQIRTTRKPACREYKTGGEMAIEYCKRFQKHYINVKKHRQQKKLTIFALTRQREWFENMRPTKPIQVESALKMLNKQAAKNDTNKMNLNPFYTEPREPPIPNPKKQSMRKKHCRTKEAYSLLKLVPKNKVYFSKGRKIT